MFYNQFNNSNCCNNREEKDNNNKVKGYCTVKVIQECSYPSYFDLNDKDDDKCNKYDNKNNCYDRKDNWEEEKTCQCKQKEEVHTCRNERRNCNFCGCFRRW